MELISNLALGFSVSLHPINLFFGFAGVALGVIIGILPGLGAGYLFVEFVLEYVARGGGSGESVASE